MLNHTDASIWSVDPELRLLSANQSFFEAQFHVSGRRLEPGDSVMSPQFPADMRAQWADWYTRALRGDPFAVTTRIEMPDGPRINEHNLSPILNAVGDTIGVSVVSTNISVRTVAREALQASEARFRTLTSASPMGIVLADTR